MHMKAFLHFLKKLLNDKYPHIDFGFYFSRRTQSVHIGLNFSLLILHEYEQIFLILSNFVLKKDDKKFEFILLQLIHIVK